MLPQRPLVTHSELLHHASGGGIGAEVLRKNAVIAPRERPIAQRRCRLGRVASAPVFRADPVAQLAVVAVRVVGQADTAVERPVRKDAAASSPWISPPRSTGALPPPRPPRETDAKAAFAS